MQSESSFLKHLLTFVSLVVKYFWKMLLRNAISWNLSNTYLHCDIKSGVGTKFRAFRYLIAGKLPSESEDSSQTSIPWPMDCNEFLVLQDPLIFRCPSMKIKQFTLTYNTNSLNSNEWELLKLLIWSITNHY